jgi:hypothetical protein
MSERLNEVATAIACIVASIFILALSIERVSAGNSYQPPPQIVILDYQNRPIGSQDLLEDVNYIPDCPPDQEPPVCFAKKFILDSLSYDKKDHSEGRVYESFQYYTGDESLTLYEQFSNMSIQRAVYAQNGIVRSQLIGDLKTQQSLNLTYVRLNGAKLLSKASFIKGRMKLTIFGEEEFPSLYDVELIVQRAEIQDKEAGYFIKAATFNLIH